MTPDEIQDPPAKKNHVNQGDDVSINPVIINDTHRERPRKNLEIIAHSDGMLLGERNISLSAKELETIIRWLATNRRGFIEDSLLSTEHKCMYCER